MVLHLFMGKDDGNTPQPHLPYSHLIIENATETKRCRHRIIQIIHVSLNKSMWNDPSIIIIIINFG